MSSSVTPGAEANTRRTLTDRQAETLARLVAASADELRAHSWSGLTVRNVARRAGVAPATAYTYFASREHLVTEVYRRRVFALGDPAVDTSLPPAQRVTEVLRPLSLLVADEPQLAAAVTVAMLSDDAEVAALRDEIGMRTAQLIRAAVGNDASPSQLLTLDAAFSGLLLTAGMGHLDYAELPERTAEVAAVVFGDTNDREDSR
ncbi:MAG: TetR/AcrR family transcriptional regulator [Actinomycetia bacterium]|nr:TetR/AcrR family transcriptional regulator [Actinomycetes bacterium]